MQTYLLVVQIGINYIIYFACSLNVITFHSFHSNVCLQLFHFSNPSLCIITLIIDLWTESITPRKTKGERFPPFRSFFKLPSFRTKFKPKIIPEKDLFRQDTVYFFHKITIFSIFLRFIKTMSILDAFSQTRSFNRPISFSSS